MASYEYMSIGGDEFINPSRTATYIARHLPGLDLECEIPNMAVHTQAGQYVSPLVDNAPWISSDPDSHEFYGGIPSVVQGLKDSNQTVSVQDLKGDGAVAGLRRNTAREIRVVMTLFAKTDAALEYGVDWYTHALSGGYCPSFGVPYCEGEQLVVMPSTESATELNRMARLYYDVKSLQGVKVQESLLFRNAKAKVIEFILIAGNPFIYRSNRLGILPFRQASFTTTHTEQYCDPEAQAFDQLITDPARGSVIRPPRPPLISPVTMPESWQRATLGFPVEQMNLPGQAVFRVTIRSSGVLRMARLRFYRPSAANCDYSGEFLITYKPGGQDMIIDGVSKKIWIRRNGRDVPAGNLVIGSAGRPMKWPEIDCQQPITVHVDHAVGAPQNIQVDVEAFNRR